MTSDLLSRADRLRQLMAEDRRFANWGEAYDQLVEPYERAVERLRAGNHEDIDMLIEYLEARPKFFRSGYLAEKLMRRLARTSLTARQRARARAAIESISLERSRERGQALKVLARWDADVS